MNDSGGSSPKIKVVDRRWFTEEGDPRSDRPETAQRTPRLDASTATETTASQPPQATSREFLDLVAMLAQQAELMLVGAEGLEPHREEARHLIDALGALETKTRGNLSPQESRLLSDVLYQLRRMFVGSQ